METAMAEEKFSDNLMRIIAAELHMSNCLIGAREMFGRGYFSLGETEKAALHQTVLLAVGGNYQALTPEFLAAQKAQQPVGFVTPKQ
jgi:hypothetical protein